MKPTPDAERVLGQIARGEVIAGPEGARRIAAAHEAAYGDVWTPQPAEPATPPSADEQWADALASLTNTALEDERS